MLQTDFKPPSKEVAQHETKRRLEALQNFLPRINHAITSLTVTGSMASGQNYSVTEKSDLDIQLTITRDTLPLLRSTNVFDESSFEKPFAAFEDGVIKQFSFAVEIEGITHECHFWEEKAYIEAMEMKTEFTKRIRTSNASPAVDYGFSFDGETNEYVCPTEELDGNFISVLPTYRYVNNKLYLCRPVTSLLSTPLILFGQDLLQKHIDYVWSNVINLLVKESKGIVNLQEMNILNALPSKFKMSVESKKIILNRTITELDKLGVTYKV